MTATPKTLSRDAPGRELVKPVQLAVVGLGYWGPNLVRNILASQGGDLVSVCESRVDRLQEVSRRLPGVRCESDLDRILADEGVEGVVIATRVSTHYELAAACLRAGKHVFVEKPLARSSVESVRLKGLADERSLVLMPGHTFVYSPSVVLVKELIDSGAIGDVHYISMSRVNLGIHQSEASVLWDLAPHDFAILRYWLSAPPASLSVSGRACVMPGVHDVAFVTIAFSDGVIAHVELSWLAPSKLRRTVIVGSEKMIVYDDTSTEPVRIFDSGVELPDPQTFGEYRLSYRTGSIVSPHVDATEPLALEIDDFCQAVRSGGPLRSSWQLGHDVVCMIEAAESSLKRGVRVELAPG